ncbi:MAG TPA: hydrogenase maturation nickel metallochaperone HypA [Bryobacteraceae bacterium]|nr:hydrogenase maturation nickel metallochaperone HypA [Bryobacteraceae bacterium]
MHEIGIAASIVEAVRTEMRPYNDTRPVKVVVKVGAMSGVDRDSLSFCFQAITRGTLFEGLTLSIEDTPADELELSRLELEEP